MTATEPGAKNGRIDAAAAIRAWAPPGPRPLVCPQVERQMVDAGVEIEADREPRTAEDLQHLVVVAKYVGLEGLDAGSARATAGQRASSCVPMPCPWAMSDTAKATSA